LVLAAAAGQARLLCPNSTLLARGAYLERRSRYPLQTVLGSIDQTVQKKLANPNPLFMLAGKYSRF